MSTPWGNVPAPGTAVQELNARLGESGIRWSAKRFPWVRVESFASTCGLTLDGLGSLYESGYAIPKPVVTKVSVKKQGELGTTRRAVVSITAFNDAQLLQLQNCFFIPGMSVRVQFGWSVCASGGAPSPLSGAMPDSKATTALSTKGACMDGLQGRVAHFNYSLTSANTWECTVEIIAATEGVGGVNVDNNCCKCSIKTKTEKGEETSKNVPNMLAMFIHLATNETNKSSYPELSGPGCAVMTADFNANARNPDGSAPTGIIAWIADKVDATVTETYISYGALESAINANQPKGGGLNVAGKINSSNTLLKSPSKLMSADPRVCLVNTGNQSSILASTTGNFPAFGGKLQNIMINCIFLGQVFRRIYDTQGTLKQFVEDVLAGVNDACGGLWQFDIISNDEEEVPTIQVISNKGIPSSPTPIPTKAVREVKIDLKLTDAMKTAALYSNRSTDVNLPCSNRDLCPEVGLFELNRGATNGANPPLSTPAPCPCEGVADEEAVGEKLTYGSALTKLQEEVSDATVQGFKTFLVESYNGQEGPDKKECEGTFLPMSYGFTADGVGGFRYGQIISSDRISTGKYVFQITSVEHEVSAHDWTTTVSTVTRYKQ